MEFLLLITLRALYVIVYYNLISVSIYLFISIYLIGIYIISAWKSETQNWR